MTIGRVSTGLTALALTGIAAVGLAGPALAQAAPPDRPCGRGNGNPPAYPPGQQKKGSVSDSTPARGEQVTATSGPGAFDGNSRARACFHSTPVDLGVVTVAPNGAATITFTVPGNASAGQHFVSFSGYNQGQPSEVDVALAVGAQSASGVAPGQSGTTLPRTGANNLVPLGIGGGGLVAVGAGMVVVARRRRDAGPTLAA